MIRAKKIAFKNDKGQTLQGYVHKPKVYDTAFLYLHGFPGHMGGTAEGWCRHFAEKGLLCMRFDFSGSDTSEGNFEDKLMSQEVKEIKTAIDFLEEKYGFEALVLMGHSTGAIDAALYAYRDKRVTKLILSGAVSDLKHAARYDFTDEQVRDFWTKGYVTYKNTNPRKKTWWCHNKRMKKAFYDEFFVLDIPKAMKKYKNPLLILHGEYDEAIPVAKDPHELFAYCNTPKHLAIIKKADHSFKNPGTFKKATKAVEKFIK